MSKILHGLKEFFKEEKLSDRRIRIIEIEESFDGKLDKPGNKRYCSDLLDEAPSSSKRVRGEERFGDEKPSSQEEICKSPSTSSFNPSVESKQTGQVGQQQANKILAVSNDSDKEENLNVDDNVIKEGNEKRSADIVTPTIANNSSDLPVRNQNTSAVKPTSTTRNIECQQSTTKIDSTNSSNTVVTTLPTTTALHCQQNHKNTSVKISTTVYSELPVHSIVLCLNSWYFQQLLVDSGMKENRMSTVDIKVNRGEGQFLEILLKAFYDEDILEESTLPVLLSVMDIAARFSCTSFVDLGLELLDKKKVTTLDECNSILQCVSRVFQTYDSNEKFKKTWNACIKFLCKTLFPLEFRFVQQEKFKRLDHRTVLSLLRSPHAFVLHENHLFIFAYQWLESNPDSQTPEIIESFLSALKFESLTVTFLTDELTICDRILNKWPGYAHWFATTLKYHTLSHGNRELRGFRTPGIASRGCVAPMNNSLYECTHFSLVTLDTDETTTKRQLVCTDENRFLWNGVLMSPVLTIKENDETSSYIRMRMVKYNGFQPVEPICQFYQRFDFYFCLLPAFVTFKTALLRHKNFIKKFVRKGEIEFRSANVSSMHAVAKVDDEFVETLREHGLCLTLFFKKTSFSWLKFDTNTVKPSKKLILLNQQKNYQQYVI